MDQEQVLSNAVRKKATQDLTQVEDAVVPHTAVGSGDQPQRDDQEQAGPGRDAQERESRGAKCTASRLGRRHSGGDVDGIRDCSHAQ
jgi:hypothetical protein